MRMARTPSIQHKLIAIIMLTSTVALLLACATFVAYETITYQETITEQLSIVAQIVAGNSMAPLAFDDRKSANEMLAALRAEPRIVSACIYTSDGRPFAAYLGGESRRDLPRFPRPGGAVFEHGYLILFQPITFDGEHLGTVYLKRDLEDVYARLRRYAGIVLAVLLAASLAALLISARLQRVISRPVIDLAATASRVSADRNYALRAVKTSDDELGALADRFNEMMAQIQARDLDLHAAHSALERHVDELRAEIVERQRIQEELFTAKQAAEESSRAKSTFLANMSHELRTPLNAIIGYSEMMREEAAENGQHGFLADLLRVHSAGKHLLNLINDVLDLSKIEAGKTDLLLEEAPIAPILADAANTAEPLARQNHNKLLVRYGEGLHTVHVDALKFRQCLYNLLSNACKFTENGTVTLEVLRVAGDGGDWIEWRVTDTGIGIAQSQMHKLFGSFSQVDASTTRKYGGTGLGLAISQRFCQLMGGVITVVSRPGEGSTFTIRIPQPKEKSAAPPPPAPQIAVAAPPEPRVCAGNRILVIDNDPTVQDLLRRSLTREGYDVAASSSGEDGLRQAKDLRPFAITLDVLLPGMDGWSVLRALKADPALAEIPVILHTITDNRSLGYALGAADYLQKPVQSDRLIAALRKCQPAKLAGPVLVVDDDPAARDMLTRILRKQFRSVNEAADGRAALARVAQTKPALILLDLMMPGMDGFEFVAALHRNADWQKIPIVVLTAKEVTRAERKQLDGDVARVFQKGAYPRDELVQTVCDLARAQAAPAPGKGSPWPC